MSNGLSAIAHWTPHIGPRYRQRRLLLLGESCYYLEDDNGEMVEPERKHPQNMVAWAGKDPDYRYRFVTMLVRALVGRYDLDEADWTTAWDDVAFTNFIPTVVDGRARARPSAEQWNLARSLWHPLLELLRPLNVIVLGKGLWNAMPEAIPHRGPDCQRYTLSDGQPVTCLAVNHPAGGLSWEKLSSAITTLEGSQT